MNKRITSLVLVLVMVVSLLVTTVAAPGVAKAGSNGLMVSQTELEPGDTFTVTLRYPAVEKQISDMQGRVRFDKTVFEVTSYTAPSIAGMGKMQSNVSEANNAGAFSVTYDSDSSDADITFTGLDLTATFKVKDTAAAGNYEFKLDNCKIGSLTDMGTPDILMKDADFDVSSVTVTVKAPVIEPTGIELNKDTLALKSGASETLVATIAPEGAEGTVTWSSSNDKVATVDETGKVTAVAKGTATITAKVGTFQATCAVTVACSHRKGDDVAAKPATCTEPGHKAYFYCDECKTYFKDAAMTEAYGENEWVLSALGHNVTLTPAKAATCTATGNSAYYTCGRCGKYFSNQAATKEIAENSWVLSTIAHDYKWVIDTEPTEEATGLKHEECTMCQAKRSVGTVIPKLDHTHNMQYHAANPATCTADGTVEYWHCAKCGKDYADSNGATELTSVKAEALGHSMTHHAANPATCLKDGTKEYWACARCNKNFADANGAQELTSIVDKSTGHAYGAYVETKPATCLDKGQETATCAKCNGKIYRDIAALGHDYGAYVETKAATCTEPGKETSTCSRCQDKLVRDTDALGHQPGEFTETKPATCADKGEKVATCGVCQAEVKVEIPALGHKWDNGVVTKAATATEKGEKTFTCETCHLTRTEEIAALGGGDTGVATGDSAPIAVFTLLAVLSAGSVLVLGKKKAERD